MFEKLKAAVSLVRQAVAHPQSVLFALRERGLWHLLRRFWNSDAASLDAMARDVRFRSRPATRENLQAYYTDISFEPLDDPDHHLIRVPSGERFFIRTARGWHDLGTIHDTFVKQIYGDHPPVAGKTVIDVGANIGDTAVYFAKRGAHVVAYEPDPEMCALARRNASLNGLTIKVRDAGIGSKSETLLLSSSPSGADSMSVTLFRGVTPVNRMHIKTTPVRIAAFADELACFDTLGLVKFDCEGCEYPALAGLPHELMRRIEHIIMEYHSHGEALAETLRSAGFSVRLKGEMYMLADRIPLSEGTGIAAH